MLESTGSHGDGVDMIEPDIVLIAELSWMSTNFTNSAPVLIRRHKRDDGDRYVSTWNYYHPILRQMAAH